MLLGVRDSVTILLLGHTKLLVGEQADHVTLREFLVEVVDELQGTLLAGEVAAIVGVVTTHVPVAVTLNGGDVLLGNELASNRCELCPINLVS